MMKPNNCNTVVEVDLMRLNELVRKANKYDSLKDSISNATNTSLINDTLLVNTQVKTLLMAVLPDIVDVRKVKNVVLVP